MCLFFEDPAKQKFTYTAWGWVGYTDETGCSHNTIIEWRLDEIELETLEKTVRHCGYGHKRHSFCDDVLFYKRGRSGWWLMNLTKYGYTSLHKSQAKKT